MTDISKEGACFTFEAYVPYCVTADGVTMMHNIRHQVQQVKGEALTRAALMQAFEQFLRGAGIEDSKEGQSTCKHSLSWS